MEAGTFKGGVHPYDGKELSMDKPITTLLPKGLLVYPVSQHAGAPAKPIVTVGDRVLVGQMIAEAAGYISAPVISSVSGTVKAIEPRLTASGDDVLSIIVENDNEYKTVDSMGAKRDYTKLSKNQIRDIIKEAGIVGMGGAGFPTHVKLTTKNDNEVEYIIVNGAECEPYLTSDYRLMIEKPMRIVTGLRIVLRLFDKAKGIIAIEDNKPDAVEKMKQAAGTDGRIEVKTVKTKYPQGGERTLIYATTGRQINSSMLPFDAGCIMNNVTTLEAVYMAVAESTPLIRCIFTVTGDAVASPGNFDVRTGTNYAEILEAAGGFKTQPEKIISGGPFMGKALYSLDIPVTKTSSALLAFTKDEVSKNEPGPCIRCGRCLTVCPGRIVVQKVMDAAERFDNSAFEQLGGMECCECGCCTYICPADRRLTQSFAQMRKSVRENKK